MTGDTTYGTVENIVALEALDRALARGRPAIFNTDQGSQFTSHAFTGRLQAAEVRISMDGRGRALDNIFVERLWRSVKYEEVYLKSYSTVPAAIDGLASYFRFYNEERLHQSLAYRTPSAIYHADRAVSPPARPVSNDIQLPGDIPHLSRP